MTARLTAINPAEATGKTKELLEAVKAKLGRAPNLIKTLANSPAALEAYLNFSASLSGGLLDGKLREQIALAVGEANRCQYCVSAHTAIGKMAGLDEETLKAARQASSSDAKTDAALKFARSILESRGDVTDDDVKKVKDAGYSEGEITEIVANTVLNIFTNYFNLAARTEVDFPKVELALKSKA